MNSALSRHVRVRQSWKSTLVQVAWPPQLIANKRTIAASTGAMVDEEYPVIDTTTIQNIIELPKEEAIRNLRSAREEGPYSVVSFHPHSALTSSFLGGDISQSQFTSSRNDDDDDDDILAAFRLARKCEVILLV